MPIDLDDPLHSRREGAHALLLLAVGSGLGHRCRVPSLGLFEDGEGLLESPNFASGSGDAAENVQRLPGDSLAL